MTQIILLLPFTLCYLLHDYHVSIYNIHFNEESRKLEVSQKFFVDDFERALEISGNKTIFGKDLVSARESANARAYIKEHFTIKVKDEKVDLNFVGAEWEDVHAMYFYWESEELPEFEEISITNTIFLEVSNQQENMHYFTYGKKPPESLLLNSKLSSGGFKDL